MQWGIDGIFVQFRHFSLKNDEFDSFRSQKPLPFDFSAGVGRRKHL